MLISSNDERNSLKCNDGSIPLVSAFVIEYEELLYSPWVKVVDVPFWKAWTAGQAVVGYRNRIELNLKSPTPRPRSSLLFPGLNIYKEMCACIYWGLSRIVWLSEQRALEPNALLLSKCQYYAWNKSWVGDMEQKSMQHAVIRITNHNPSISLYTFVHFTERIPWVK